MTKFDLWRNQVCNSWINLSHSYYHESGQLDTFMIVIIVQLLFSLVYGGMYAIFCHNRRSVTKMHMFVLYINTSFWGWAIYVLLYIFVCNGFRSIGTPLSITAFSFLGVFCLVGCIEVCCSREGGYFRHQKTMNECIQYMSAMKETAPIHQIHIECYHYVTEYHTTTDSNGNSHTTTSRRRVTSHRETRNFIYDRWVDQSDYPNLPEICMEMPIVAVESTYIVAPGDDFTLREFDLFRSNFSAEMRRRDDYIDETIETIVPGHIAKVTAKSEKKGEVPWWLNSGFFYILAMLFCSCPLRVRFRSKAKKHKFEIRKLYFVEQLGTNIANTEVNFTINVVNNKGTVNIDTDPDGIPMVEQYPPPPTMHPYSVAPIQVDQAPLGFQAPSGYQPVDRSNSPIMPPPPYNPNMI